MKEPGKAPIANIVCATKESFFVAPTMCPNDTQKEAKLITYFQILNYLPDTYGTDEVIAEFEAETTNIKQLEGVSAVRYSEVVWKKDYAVVLYTVSHV